MVAMASIAGWRRATLGWLLPPLSLLSTLFATRIESAATMSADDYLRSVLAKYDVNPAGPRAVAEHHIAPVIQAWGGQYLRSIRLSGSIAKGTANAGANDMDLFIELEPATPLGLMGIYESLLAAAARQWPARRQNVSVGINAGGYHFDLVPARLQAGYQNWFALWRDKQKTWTQTNVELQVQTVAKSGRTEEIRILKRWRTLAGLEFPSFVLELATLRALDGLPLGALAHNVSAALSWLGANIETARLVDPANMNNIVSDDLTSAERSAIARAARAARAQPHYNDFVW
jgi:hypothetical protein